MYCRKEILNMFEEKQGGGKTGLFEDILLLQPLTNTDEKPAFALCANTWKCSMLSETRA